MIVRDMIAFVTSADSATFLAMFWYLAFIEGPRFVIANAAAGIAFFHGPREFGSAKIGDHSRSCPSVSVLLPCHNGAAGLLKTVASLREQTLPDLEIIVVDDGSSDGTARAAQWLRAHGQVDLFLSTSLRGGKSAALNLGLRYCTGTLVVSVDADTTFDRDSFDEIVALFEDPSVGAVGGNVGVRNAERSVLASLQAVEYAIGISLGRKVSTMLGILPVVSGAFAAFRREALVAVGGWEAGSGEDADLTMKLRRAGWEVRFASNAWALTDVPLTVPGLVRQRLRWESDLIRLHTRKFRMLLCPWSREFSFRDTLSAVDVLIFSIGLSFCFVTYVVWTIATYGTFAVPVLFAAGLIYSLIGLITFLFATAFERSNISMRLFPYALGYGFYCVYLLHPVRIWACIEELTFDRSYRSTFVPRKVLNRIGRF